MPMNNKLDEKMAGITRAINTMVKLVVNMETMLPTNENSNYK